MYHKALNSLGAKVPDRVPYVPILTLAQPLTHTVFLEGGSELR